MNYSDYSKIIVAFSGGKDSLACLLHLLDQGVPTHKIELWHHLIDGKDEAFMDWPITESYCQAVADAFDVPIYFSYREGGFLSEMMRNNQPTGAVVFQDQDHNWQRRGGKGPKNTRLKFPQVTADLRTRWCSAYLKIDVCSTAIRGQDRFNYSKTLLITGERAEESPARSMYKIFETDRADARDGKLKRHVDRYRPVLSWSESLVWETIERYGVVAHPCYYIGWSRCSCQFCIFGNADQFASAYRMSPHRGNLMIDLEEQFGVTIKRKQSLTELIVNGEIYRECIDEKEMATLSQSTQWKGPVIVTNWTLPGGAYGDGCGPI